MNELPLLAAAGLGLVMTVSPCPLATNIAAVAYLGRYGANPRAVAAGGAAYALGRALAYTVLATVLAKGLFAMPAVSWFLQNRLQGLIGPLLIFTGLILLGWISLPAFRGGLNARRMERLGAAGLLGEFLLGALFALALCPVSAALFFGSLMPLVLRTGQVLALPAVFGAATALPVLAFALVLAVSARAASRLVSGLQTWGARLQPALGLLLALVGVWITVDTAFLR